MNCGTFSTSTMGQTVEGLRSLIGAKPSEGSTDKKTREGEEPQGTVGDAGKQKEEEGEVKISPEMEAKIKREEEELEVEDTWGTEVGVRLAGSEREIM